MHTSKALKNVRSLIRGTLERHHHSIRIVDILSGDIEDCVNILKEQFEAASKCAGEKMIWPKMVLEYKPDGEDNIIPVLSPIQDSRGYILGLKVVCREHPKNGTLGAKVYLEWESPDP